MTVVAVPGARARAAITASPRDDEAQATGSGNSTIAPCGSLGAAHSRPPCAPMIERLIDSRMPTPPGLCGEERAEHAIQVARADADAGIVHGHPNQCCRRDE